MCVTAFCHAQWLHCNVMNNDISVSRSTKWTIQLCSTASVFEREREKKKNDCGHKRLRVPKGTKLMEKTETIARAYNKLRIFTGWLIAFSPFTAIILLFLTMVFFSLSSPGVPIPVAWWHTIYQRLTNKCLAKLKESGNDAVTGSPYHPQVPHHQIEASHPLPSHNTHHQRISKQTQHINFVRPCGTRYIKSVIFIHFITQLSAAATSSS